MKFERHHISAFVIIAAAVWLIVLLCQGTPVSWAHARPFSIVVSIVVGLGLLFELVLWRQPWLHGWFVKRPDLRGTWRVSFFSLVSLVPLFVCAFVEGGPTGREGRGARPEPGSPPFPWAAVGSFPGEATALWTETHTCGSG